MPGQAGNKDCAYGSVTSPTSTLESRDSGIIGEICTRIYREQSEMKNTKTLKDKADIIIRIIFLLLTFQLPYSLCGI